MNHINKLSILRNEIIQIANKHGFKLKENESPITVEQAYEIICRLDKIITQQDEILTLYRNKVTIK